MSQLVGARALDELWSRVASLPGVVARRNEAQPVDVPESGLVIMRDGSAGEPEVTLSPRVEFYQHWSELEVYMPRRGEPGAAETALYDLVWALRGKVAEDRTLGGHADYARCGMPEVSTLWIEGAMPVLAARLEVVLGYCEPGGA